jgi:hypothetical protein
VSGLPVNTLAGIVGGLVLTILPGAWIMYGLRIAGLPAVARPALAIALSPAVVGLQLVALESLGLSFARSAYALPLLNLPAVILLVRHYRKEPPAFDWRSWLSAAPLVALLAGIPIATWVLVPGLRVYQWETMLQMDVVYAIARDGAQVEEANLAGLNLAYGWVGHSYWSVVGWLGDWAPTRLYPVTNTLWIVVTFVLGYELGRTGLGLHRTTALLGVTLMFLGTNIAGIVLRLFAGYTDWWARYFGDIRYSPFLGKFYTFDTMLWGMTLLLGLALVYAVALRRRVAALDGLSAALLVGLGVVYPVLFPAGLALAGSFLLLAIFRPAKDVPTYGRSEVARLGAAVALSVVAAGLYLALVTADRDVAAFALSQRSDIKLKAYRFLAALGPFIVLAALPMFAFVRSRYGPALLMALWVVPLSAAYVFIDLTQLEYKYVLAATIGLAFLAAAAVDRLFRRRPRSGWGIGAFVAAALAVANLLLVFRAGEHIPGNLAAGMPLDESSFWIALSPSEPDSSWTTAIRLDTDPNTIVIAQKPGVQLSALVGRSMYVPSDTDGGRVPGYNLDQRFYLLKQRGYPADLYERRLEVVAALYTSQEEADLIAALSDLKELRRPVAIDFASPNAFSLRWLEAQAIGRVLVANSQNTVWLVDDLGTLP